MEQGEVTDFSDIHKIDRIRLTNAQRHALYVTVSSQNTYLCPAITIIKNLVPMKRLMGQRVLSKDTYAQHALQKEAKVSHIRKLNEDA